MSTDPGYRVRLKARIGKGLSTDDNTLTADFHGKPLTVRAAEQDQPLNEAIWLVFGAGGFATADGARDYGERLRRTVRLAGISAAVGVDARTAVGDRTISYLSPAGEDWLRSLGLMQPEHRTAPDMHGLFVLPDDDSLRMFSSIARAQVLHDAAEFVRSLEEAAQGNESRETARALHALNLAQINHEPLAQVVLAVSSIEALAADDEGWTDAQLGMIEWAAARVGSRFGADANPVVDAIRKTHHRSLRQQPRRLWRATWPPRPLVRMGGRLRPPLRSLPR